MAAKIRIRLFTIAAGPHFTLGPGVIELDAEQAEAMIAGGHAERVEEPEPQAEAQPAGDVVETATAAPQRSQEADDLVAVQRAGHIAAAASEERKNPYDGRSAQGRAWARGYDSYQQEYRLPKQE